MGTLIENINAISKIKADLNAILRENGSDGGPVFMDYPDKFRELFRVVDDYVDATEEGYEYKISNTQTVVPDPVITYYQNVVTITCSLDNAIIRYWVKSDSGNNDIGLNTLQKGSTIYLSENSTVYCYAQYREEKSNEVSLWVPVDNIEIPIPPVIERDGTTVTITSEQGYDIYYKIGSGGTYYQYTEAITVARTEDVYSFTRGYRANSNEVVDKAPEQPATPLPPVITCIENVIYITCETENVSLFYKEENGRWMQYTGPVSITESGFYYAKSVNSHYIEAISNKKYCEYKEPAEPVVLAEPVISCSDNIVTITCSTIGADIFYSTDGTNYSKYTQPISIQADTTFYAFSSLNGRTSNIVGPYLAEYTEQIIIPAVPVVLCSDNIVIITCSTSGATIYYSTTSNSGPWAQYTQPIEIQEDTTFWSYSSLNGQNSDVSEGYEADYIDNTPAIPVIIFDNDNDIFISCDTDGATIYYKINDGSYTEYQYGFGITGDCTITAYSSKNGLDSDTTSLFCDYTPINYNNEYLTIKYMGYEGNHTNASVFDFVCHIWDEGMTSGINYYNLVKKPIMYSTDKITWNNFTPNVYFITGQYKYNQYGSAPIQLNVGDKIYIKGNNAAYGITDYNVITYYHTIKLNQYSKVKVYGNVMSLINANSFSSLTSFTGSGDNLMGLFDNQYFKSYNAITDISNIVLPATTLKPGCYDRMFRYNKQINKLPALPATTLAGADYVEMYKGCTSITEGPDLNATIMAPGSYAHMFEECTSLRKIKVMATEASWYHENNINNSLPANYANRYIEEDCEGMIGGPNSPQCIFIKNRNALGNFWNYRAQSPANVNIKNSIMPSQWTIVDSDT